MQRLMIVKGKIERYKLLFDGLPGYRCDVRTIIVIIDKQEKNVTVTQQFWFKDVHTRIYLSDLAMKRARKLYKLISLDPRFEVHGSRTVGDRFYFWASMKVYG